MTTLHAEISIVPIGTGSTGISKEVAAAFDAIRKTKDIKTTKLTAMGTQVEANDMRAILNAIEAAHQAVKLTGNACSHSCCNDKHNCDTSICNNIFL